MPCGLIPSNRPREWPGDRRTIRHCRVLATGLDVGAQLGPRPTLDLTVLEWRRPGPFPPACVAISRTSGIARDIPCWSEIPSGSKPVPPPDRVLIPATNAKDVGDGVCRSGQCQLGGQESKRPVRHDCRDKDQDWRCGSTTAHQNLRKNSGKAFPRRRSSVSVSAGTVSSGLSRGAFAALD